MKEQISTSERDLKTTYILFSLLPIMIGSVFLVFIFMEEGQLADSVFIKYFSLGCIIVGLICLILSYLFVPYCYKIEVDADKIYITKSETVILTQIEKTISVNKDLLQDVTGSWLGLAFSWWEYKLYYLHFAVETEYGGKIAFLSSLTPSFHYISELKRLKK